MSVIVNCIQVVLYQCWQFPSSLLSVTISSLFPVTCNVSFLLPCFLSHARSQGTTNMPKRSLHGAVLCMLPSLSSGFTMIYKFLRVLLTRLVTCHALRMVHIIAYLKMSHTSGMCSPVFVCLQSEMLANHSFLR